jgi:3-oxoacyl-[acyl-carrier protein] reductase
MDLKESVVVVTGGARGIGYAIAEDLAKAGAKLALIDSDQAQLERSSAELAAHTEVQGYAVDVTDEALIEATFQYILQDFGKVNAVINNAGVLKDGLLLKVKDGQLIDKMSLAQFKQVCDIHMDGTFLCGREGALSMIASGQKGVIVNMSSLARSGNRGQTNYAAAKSAVASMAITWAAELARHGIRSVAVAPGVVETEMVKSMKPEALARLKQAIPAGRLAKPEEIAATVRFILEQDYINGRVIEVDGGLRF